MCDEFGLRFRVGVGVGISIRVGVMEAAESEN
jgi:hypothetical protein